MKNSYQIKLSKKARKQRHRHFPVTPHRETQPFQQISLLGPQILYVPYIPEKKQMPTREK